MALAEAELGNWETAQENLVKALDYKIEAKLNAIDKALQSTLVCHFPFKSVKLIFYGGTI